MRKHDETNSGSCNPHRACQPDSRRLQQGGKLQIGRGSSEETEQDRQCPAFLSYGSDDYCRRGDLDLTRFLDPISDSELCAEFLVATPLSAQMRRMNTAGRAIRISLAGTPTMHGLTQPGSFGYIIPIDLDRTRAPQGSVMFICNY